jgi:hypothetical protein
LLCSITSLEDDRAAKENHADSAKSKPPNGPIADADAIDQTGSSKQTTRKMLNNTQHVE